MSATLRDRTVFPSEEASERRLSEALSVMLRSPGTSPRPRLVGPDGTEHELPEDIYEVLLDVAAALDRGQAVTVAPRDTLLTTMEAADFLGVSRPTLVSLLERGEISYERPGRHRKVRLQDIIEYRDRKRVDRRKAIENIQAASEEMDLYDEGDEGSSR